ncbi:serine hydrolase domain-containing protein [Haloferula sp. BvORR071]|uniref:serine hydrolase domain-containing protein n=1 Tax=Haloferula sp. BvORR071 TaxID=1396141 RepID=UPI00054CD849|nr:serine hydrolase domain-containing protein [Haloferula sp. BvORR071]
MSSPLLATDYSAAINGYEATVKAEMKEWDLGGIAVAWVDGQSIVYEKGFGEAKADSVFRAGSVSKLFNAVAVMQLAEQGKLDIDAPLPAARLPVNPFDGQAITLRHLLCHRSGMQREATVGGYFDDKEPTLKATVDSLKGSALASPPNSENRYSNIAPSLAGQIASEAAGKPFPDLQRAAILKPLGMNRSAWLHKDVHEVLASHIRAADGKGGFKERSTPVFDLGTIPAGNLFTTAGDLGRFMMMLAAGGDSPGGRILKKETLEEMWKPQFDQNGSFGIGFAVGEWKGLKTVGHGGAVYGHSTALTYLPQHKIGVVVLINEDIVNGRSQYLANEALIRMLEAKGVKLPPAKKTVEAGEELASLAGAWESQSFWMELKADGKLLRGNVSSQPCTLQPGAKDRYVLESKIHDHLSVAVERDEKGEVKTLVAGAQRFTRVLEKREVPKEWKALTGGYGPGLIPFVVHAKHGRLYATTENMVDYRLTPVNRHVFALPEGMYFKEHAVFLADESGKVSAVEFANMRLERIK